MRSALRGPVIDVFVQPITLRVCHSPWRPISQHVLAVFRLLLSGYLVSVLGVSLKYKLEQVDSHTGWRIPFQFSTVSFVLLTLYHLQATVSPVSLSSMSCPATPANVGVRHKLWTIMHIYVPHELDEDPAECRGHHVRNRIINMFTPSSQAGHCSHKYRFSMFYTASHVFTFMNTIIYWAVLVPSGHGGFKPPQMPHHHHTPGNATSAAFDPGTWFPLHPWYGINMTSMLTASTDKGLFNDGTIKSFSIINVWSITSVIALIEIFALNSIRRQRVSH